MSKQGGSAITRRSSRQQGVPGSHGGAKMSFPQLTDQSSVMRGDLSLVMRQAGGNRKENDWT